MIVREMIEADLAAVLKIEEEAYRHPWSYIHFMNELTNREICYNFVLEAEEKIIGYAGFYLLFEDASITKVTIAKEYRGRKIGDILLADLLTRIQGAGCLRAILEVRISNIKAINLYKKHQFKKIGIRKGYYQDGEDALVLERRLA